MPDFVVCAYCDTVNPRQTSACVACGAPLVKAAPVVSGAVQLDLKTKKAQAGGILEEDTLSTLQEQGEKLDDLVSGAFNLYALLWRTLVEALVITAVSLGLGIVGGATGTQVWGVLGAVLAGAAVGWAIKYFYFTLLGAPVGFVVGTLVGLLLWAFGLGKGALVFPITLFVVAAALVGGRRVPYRQRSTWHKVRPFAGALSGLAMGLAGMLIGWGLQAAVETLLGG